MKTVNYARVQLVTLLIFSISLDYYASAVAQRQQELQEAEVNGAQKSSQKIRFGTKIAKINKLNVEQPVPAAAAATRYAANQRSATNNQQNVSSAPRISSSFDYRQQVALPSAQLIAQPETHKANRKDFVSPTIVSHRVQRPRQRSELVASSATALKVSEQRNITTQARSETARRNSNQSRGVIDGVKSSNDFRRENIDSSPAARLPQRTKSRASIGGDAARVRKSSTTTTTQQSLFSRNFQQNNPFNFIPQNFWSLSVPPTTTRAPTTTPTTTTTTIKTTTRKLPKKYKHPVVTPTPFDDKYLYQKLPSVKSTEKTNLLRSSDNDGPFRIAFPTANFPNPLTAANKQQSERDKGKRDTIEPLRERFDCPRESEVRFQLFPKICKIDKDCSVWNRDELCCDIFGSKSCVSGVLKPLEETSHMPILGLIPRKCPTRPLAELWWDVKECTADDDCWPRVCCPDGRRRYCRTSEPELETVPVPVRRSFNYLTEYLECTPPPPPIFDLHPKACTSTFDCFPNVCCQEAGLRHCRPPKKSLLTLMANFLNVDFVKRLTQNIVIK